MEEQKCDYVETPDVCPKCNGKGKLVFTQYTLFGEQKKVFTCPDCQGTGKVLKRKSFVRAVKNAVIGICDSFKEMFRILLKGE